MTPREALAIAQQRDLDLIEVAPQANPPVCRIMDFGRWKFEQRKKEKETQKQSKSVELKTVRIRPHTDDHDFATKERKARRFLEEGKKVRVSMLFRGREMAHQDLARKKVLRMGERLTDVGDIERRPSMEGRQMSMIINPKPAEERRRAKAKAEAEAEAAGQPKPEEAVAPTDGEPEAAIAPAEDDEPEDDFIDEDDDDDELDDEDDEDEDDE